MSCPMETWLPRHRGILSICNRSKVPAKLVTSNSPAAHPFTGAFGQGALRRQADALPLQRVSGRRLGRRQQPLVSLSDASLDRALGFLLPGFCLSDLVWRQVEPFPVIED